MREAVPVQTCDVSVSQAPVEESDPGAIHVALLLPEQAWVDALELLLDLQPDIEVVAAHTSADWIQTAVSAGDVDLLLANIDDRTAAPSLIEKLRSYDDELHVVAVTEVEDTALLCAAVRAGVRGWVRKSASADHLLQVVRGVHRGEAWFPPAFVTTLLDSLLQAQESRVEALGVLSVLSTRELEVLNCLMDGLTRRDIAERFVLSPHTVRTHINNMLRKLNVHSTLAAVSIARQAGLGEQSNQRTSA
ncbi:MAG TPA: response regulator transcription factor [Nocardioidaceae bacterium]|nr:response regulator transcription factor [Nocardioidaceae bacterium]